MKWEYAIFTIAPNIKIDIEAREKLLKNMILTGNQEWELVAVDNNVAFFKRPAQNENFDKDELTITHMPIGDKEALEGYFGGKIG